MERIFSGLQRLALLCLIASVITACGGGSDSGSNSGGSGTPSSTYKISANKDKLNFTATQYMLPAEQTITITYDGDGVLAGYAPGTPVPHWLNITGRSTSSTQAIFTLSISNADTPGNYSTSVRFVTGKEDGSSIKYLDIPVTLKVNPLPVQPHVIYAGKNGLALTAMPGNQALSQSTTIHDNLGNPGNLSATTDKPWLAATVVGSKVTVTASPALLANGIHYANVTVTSDQRDIASPETIRVGLYVSAQAATEGAVGTILPGVGGMSPIAPLVYTISDRDKIVRAYNIYTGTLEATYPAFPGFQVAATEMSSDGQSLFAHNSSANMLYRLDFATGSWTRLANGSVGTAPQTQTLRYMRPSGKPMLLTNDGRVVDAANGRLISSDQFSLYVGDGGKYVLHDDQRHLAAIRTNIISASSQISYLEINYYPTHDLFKAKFVSGYGESNAQRPTDLLMNQDGSGLYLSYIGGGRTLSGYALAGTSLSKTRDYAQPSDGGSPPYLAVDKNKVLYAQYDSRLIAYAPNGGEILNRNISGASALMTSSDGLRVVLTGIVFGSTPGAPNTYKLHSYSITAAP